MTIPKIFQNFTRRQLLFLAGMTVLFVVGGYIYYAVNQRSERMEIQSELSSIADMKAKQIERWRMDRLNDARLLIHYPGIPAHIQNILKSNKVVANREEMMQWLASMYDTKQYEQIFLLGKSRKIVIKIPADMTTHRELIDELYDEVERTGIPKLTDIQKLKTGAPTMHLAIPIADQQKNDGTVFGVFIFCINPADNLYPMLRSLPLSSKSAEAILIRPAENGVAYLSNLRFKNVDILTFPLPAADKLSLLGVSVKNGIGNIQATDYRNVSSTAAVHTIEGSPWLLLVKMDESEWSAAGRERLWLIGLVVIAALSGVVITMRSRSSRSEQKLERQSMPEPDIEYHTVEEQENRTGDQYETAMRRAPDPVIFVDTAGEIVSVNERTLEMYGYAYDELIHRKINDLWGNGDAGEFSEKLKQANESTTVSVETDHRRKDGAIFSVEINAKPLLISGTRLYQFFIRERIKEEKIEDRRPRLIRMQNVRIALDAAIGRAEDQQNLFDEMCRAAVDEGGFAMAWIALLDESKKSAAVSSSAGSVGSYLDEATFSPSDSTDTYGPVAEAFQKEIEIFCPEIENVNGDQRWKIKALESGYRSVIAVPFRRADKVLGVYTLYSSDNEHFDKEEIDTFKGFALHLSLALERFEIHETLRRDAEVYRTMIQKIPDPVIVCSSDGTVSAVNEETVRLFGSTQKAMLGVPQRELFDEADARIKTAFDELVRSGRYSGEVRCRRADGTMFDAEIASAAFRDTFGNEWSMMRIRDIVERKKAEMVLQQSEGVLRDVFDSSPVAFQLHMKNGEMVDANRTCCKLFGIEEREALFGLKIFDLLHLSAEQQKELANGRTVQIKMPLDVSSALAHIGVQTSIKGIRLLEFHITPLGESGVPDDIQYLISITDETEMKEAENALRHDEEFTKAVLENLPDGVVACNHKGKLSLFNRTAREWHGMDIFTVPQNQWSYYYDLYDWNGTTRLSADAVPLTRAFRGEKVRDAAMTIMTKGKAPRNIVANGDPVYDANGKILGAVIVMRDVTAQIQAEREMRENDVLFRSFFTLMPGFVAIKDSDGRHLFLNHPMERLIGKSKPEWMGKTNSELYSAAEAEKLSADESQTLRSMKSCEQIDTVTIDGAEHAFFTRIFPIQREELPPLIGRISVEMTHHYNADADMKLFVEKLQGIVEKQSAQLEYADRELEDFSHSVVQNLRSPVRAIDGFSQIIGEEYERSLDDEGKRLLSVIRSNSIRLGAMFDDVLRFAQVRKSDMHSEQVDMTALARSVYHELTTESDRERIELNLPDLPVCMGDPVMMRQLWMNLISNAVKFTSQQEKASIAIGASADGSEQIYSVRDNGIGFDMHDAGRLFGIFQRLHDEQEFEGSGLGLAIARRIVTRHGGRLWAEAKPNLGATFYFALPVKTQSD